MHSFPSSEERIVASALLLLQTTPTFHKDEAPEETRSRSNKRFRETSFVTDSDDSSVSSLISGDSSDVVDGDDDKSEEIKSRPVSFFSATHRYHQMKFKIARKLRSKVMWTSSSCSVDRKEKSDATAKVSPVSVSGEATSCLSTTSSARSLRYANRIRSSASATETGIRREIKPAAAATSRRVKHVTGMPHLRRRSEAIMRFLSDGGSSEVRIRQMLGDSPDTSKALRMLLRVHAVKRSGSGGRYDPYFYSVTG